MKAIDFINNLRPAVPMSIERPCTTPSNSEIRRWLDGAMVEISGKRPKHDDEIDFPVTSLVFFPRSKGRKCTLV